MRGFFKLCFLVYFFLLAPYSAELDWEINSEIGLEIKEFHKKEAYADQKNTYSSFIKSEIFISSFNSYRPGIFIEPLIMINLSTLNISLL